MTGVLRFHRRFAGFGVVDRFAGWAESAYCGEASSLFMRDGFLAERSVV
ncbi:hypothetical protein RISK_003903 [Rhodopirellula islandica]|uniref:Uncharacterized protein n=1 Tax=Rhodopirellula islandica TaxID=595434 RepID=A0A0J1BCI6_RHOIS|nr:hypothetical protein RISK_003903 [Rhodopirellula islandica]